MLRSIKTGAGSMIYMAVAIVGVDIVECTLSPFPNGGASRSATGSLVVTILGVEQDTALDMKKLSGAVNHFKTMAARAVKMGTTKALCRSARHFAVSGTWRNAFQPVEPAEAGEC